MDQRLQQAVRPGKYRLDRESAWELGSLELMADHQPIESEHQVVSDTRAAVRHADPDRKSVVSGKSVSVRVDLGGRRIIKKKIIPKIDNESKNNKTKYKQQ